MEKIMSRGVPFCLTWPSTFAQISMLWGSSPISSTPIKPEMGAYVSRPLATVQGRPPSLASDCTFRSVMSNPSAYPSMAAIAASTAGSPATASFTLGEGSSSPLAPSFPITTQSSTSWWRDDEVDGTWIGPLEGWRYEDTGLRNTTGVVGTAFPSSVACSA